MPFKINEIIVGPIDPFGFSSRGDCILQIKKTIPNSPFHIINNYCYPDCHTGMITLAVVSKTPHTIKPYDILGRLCIVHIQDVIEDLEGKIEH
jgi:hypothetical protein